MAVSEKKRKYMKQYNRRLDVKAKKAEYMRKVRSKADKVAGKKLVGFLLDMGYENEAFEVAQERSPEMLVTVKNRVRK